MMSRSTRRLETTGREGRGLRPGRWIGGGPLVVEIMGPAGSGKTTLVRALCSKSDRVRAGVNIGKLRYVPPLIAKTGRFLPPWVLAHRRDRWLNWRETRSIACLEAWHRELERRRSSTQVSTLLDHGPVYRLALLREFGPQVVTTQTFERWWQSSRARWLDTLDIVVSLDAPDDVLLERLQARGHWYLSAGLSIEEKHAFLARFREGFSRVLGSDSRDGPTILRFRSDRTSIDEIADDVLASFGSLPAQGSER
jgi:adenylate kinase family enzyme